MSRQEYSKVKLADVARLVNGRAYLMPELQDSGKYKIVRVGNFSGKDEWFYSDMELESDKYCYKGDLLYKWACTFGPEIWNGEKTIYHYHIWKIINDTERVDRDYLYYLLKVMTPYWLAGTHGSTMVHITKEGMEGNDIAIPVDIGYQRMVARILRAIDDKIALNRKIMTGLEDIARLIYDYWFTQFDFPDESGRPYRSSGGKMVYNETLKREIPEGWEVTTVGEQSELRLGGTPDTSVQEFWGGDVSWLSSAEVATSPILRAEKSITKAGVEGSTTSFAPAGSVLLSITRYIRPSILAVDACFNQSVVAILESQALHKEFLYPFIQSQVARYLTLRTGAQQPHINKQTVSETCFSMPTELILARYYDKVAPLFNQLILTAMAADQLSSLRDWLLPMLMNGQVSVSGLSGSNEQAR